MESAGTAEKAGHMALGGERLKSRRGFSDKAGMKSTSSLRAVMDRCQFVKRYTPPEANMIKEARLLSLSLCPDDITQERACEQLQIVMCARFSVCNNA